jgi:hypothetical protein
VERWKTKRKRKKINVIITAPKKTEISFATMNRINDILFRKDDGFLQVFTTYEVVDNFEKDSVKNVNKMWLMDKVLEGRFDILIVVGYAPHMGLVKAAEAENIDIVLFKEA